MLVCLLIHADMHASSWFWKRSEVSFPKFIHGCSDGIEVRHVRSRLDHELSVGKVGVFKNIQLESCELSFITAAWETAPQLEIPLRHCSKEARGRIVYTYIYFWERGNICNQARIFCRKLLLVLGGFCESWETSITMKTFSAFLEMRRYRNWAHKISSWDYLKSSPARFPAVQSASFLISTLNSPQTMLKVSIGSSTWFNPCRGRWQAPMASAVF